MERWTSQLEPNSKLKCIKIGFATPGEGLNNHSPMERFYYMDKADEIVQFQDDFHAGGGYFWVKD